MASPCAPTADGTEFEDLQGVVPGAATVGATENYHAADCASVVNGNILQGKLPAESLQLYRQANVGDITTKNETGPQTTKPLRQERG